jgi:hypothetical protein
MSEICKMKAPFRRITKYNNVKAGTIDMGVYVYALSFMLSYIIYFVINTVN